ncbi:MAG: NF038122 family metalloprotease [Coleofasciculus sp. B1-GNL1-01]|uniref:NF038122 family metalloprotease n=1 Tax=Coleofasciculus sp. B1-GNL1-01 TaxID=3068484 RepID=UPI0032F97822
MTNKLSSLSQYVRSLTPLTALAVAVEISFGATAAQALQFNFSPSSGTSQQAIDGFTAAGDFWSDQFTDDITVNIDIGFESLGSGILGQASSNTVGSRYSTVRNALSNDRLSTDDNTAVANLQKGSFLDFLTTDPFSGKTIRDNNFTANNYYLDINRANAKALGLLSGNHSSTDATIKFNSDFNFDFNPSNGISNNAVDFMGVAVHEIGHALGFVSGVDIVDYYSEDGPGAPLSLDRYRIFSPLDLFRYSENSANQGILDLAAGSKAYFSIDGGDTNLGLFSTGSYNGDGRQASHWKDNRSLGIMDPTAARGELLSISDLDLQAFDVIGWNLAGNTSSNNTGSANSLLSTSTNNNVSDMENFAMANQYLTSTDDATSVPEPTSVIGLIALGVGFGLQRCWRDSR